MGGSKSKPKDVAQRNRSLDSNISSGGGAGSLHHNSAQQSATPNRSTIVDTDPQLVTNNAGLVLFGGVDNNRITPTGDMS